MKYGLIVILLLNLVVMGESSLLESVRSKDYPRIKTLLSEGADPNVFQPDGSTALHLAVFNGDSELVQWLIKADANANAVNRYGITPLWLACRNGQASMVRMLLEAGADPQVRQYGGQTPLMMAARSGALDTVQLLHERGADIDAREGEGQTAMMWAAAEGHAEVIGWLIERGADFRTPLKGGFTPLFFAIREGRSEVVQMLLEAGADPNEAMKPERRFSRGVAKGMTALLMAVENGHFEIAMDLVRAGARPNDQGAGYAALHAMSWVRKPDHGEGVNGMPPPDTTGRLTSLEFVRKIVALGAEINRPIEKSNGGLGALNKAGATPFLMAAKTADLPLLKLLFELGADASIKTRDEVTPLIAAAGLGTLAAGEVAGTESEVLEVLEWLIEIGQDVNAIDRNGETAMHAAAYKNLPRVVTFLADHGARMEVWNQPDKHGWTPLLIAEGFRPGNFKPSFETIAALHKVMLAGGITPPPLTDPAGVNNSDFGPRERKYTRKQNP
jgi:uncharacterized protein